MSAAFATKIFRSFDGAESTVTKHFCPDRYRILENIFSETAGTFSPQGAGLSFAPLSFSGSSSTIQMTEFNRFLSFDSEKGQIEVESGMTMGALAQFSVPKGWYLKVQPGHPAITLGGCLATDVHGKNQFRDLNFKEQVLFFRLYHPDKGYIFCDRTNNSDLFHLTCGGFGLTGLVISMGIQLGRLLSDRIESEAIIIEDIFELPKLLRERSVVDDLLYSWHDFNASGSKWGKGFLKAGRYQTKLAGELPVLSKFPVLSADVIGRMPLNLMSPYFVHAMNFAYSTKELGRRKKESLSLSEFLFPVINKTIYYDLFGRAGFHETQILIPFENFEGVMKELQRGLKKYKIPVTLASCKLFKGQAELLRFFGEGIVLAINFPRDKESSQFLEWWDRVVMESKCIPNISKDSRLPLSVVEQCYPEFSKFKSQLKLWDRERRFETSLSRRLQL